MIRIIGIGSPFGDDACGLVAARQLAHDAPVGAEVVVADRPGAGLIELMDGVDECLVIDAVHSGAPPGTVHDVDLRDLPGSSVRGVSSHDLGVAEAVQLAMVLGRLPAHCRLLGIEVGARVSAASERPAPAVRRAIGEVVHRARQWSLERSRVPASCCSLRGG
jgi:hydrogenase maturation protease